MRSDALRWSIPIIAFVLTLPLLTGCAIDKGTALAAKFEKDWDGTADLEKVHTNGYNILPFSGTATGILVLVDGTPPDRVAEHANALREYVAHNDSITGRITADGITITVDADRTRTREVVALWRSLAADERVVGGDIAGSTSKIGYRRRAEVTVVDAAGALAVFGDMVGDDGRHRPPSEVTSVRVVTQPDAQPGVRIQSDADGVPPTAAIAAYRAVAAEYPIVGATLESASVRLVVASTADRDDALELARTAAPGLDPSAVTVTGKAGA